MAYIENSVPPEASTRATHLTRWVVRPIERFLHVEAASGIVLLITAAIALGWANSPWSGAYRDLLHTPISLGIGEYTFSESLHFWINDILMVVFFFVVGLEVRRELYEGELSTPRRAALPVAAAIGGMVVPAAIYLSINAGSPATIDGWGTPMATDIAFAVGVLALLGPRIPAALRVLLLALAIIDDIGAILIIALFYSTGISIDGILVALGAMAIVLSMQRMGIRHAWLYIAPGVLLWMGILEAGIHPTIAGVILGLMTPVRSWFGRTGFISETEKALENLRPVDGVEPALMPELDRVATASREAVPPVTRIVAMLHPWVAFVIMPLFALANAGVSLDGLELGSSEAVLVASGVTAGLVIGKPIGVLLFSWLAVRMRLAVLPGGVSWAGLAVVGLVAGIGFTMALFIGALAFGDPATLGVAKLAVLVASGIAGLLGLLVGWRFLPRTPVGHIAQTPSEAERSTEM